MIKYLIEKCRTILYTYYIAYYSELIIIVSVKIQIGGKNMSKTNICLFGLAKQFTDEVGKDLSQKLDIYYANFEKIFEFEMIDVDRLEELCGKDYLEKKESSLLKRLCTYENTLINISYHLLNSEDNHNYLQKHCLIIYLKMDISRYKEEIKNDNISKGNMALNIDLFKDRDQLCEQYADIVVATKNKKVSDVVDAIIVEMLKYYE